MSTDISKEVDFWENGYDDRIKARCHYEFQSTAEIFSFHYSMENITGEIILGPEMANHLLHAIVSAGKGKMGVYLTDPYKNNLFETN